MRQLTLPQARRIAVAAQGLHRPRPRGRAGPKRLAEALRRLQLLQIDFVNVLAPAHHFVPFSRVGPYDRRHLHRLVYRQRQFIEQWAHEACVVPVELWPLLHHRRQGGHLRARKYESYLKRQGQHADWVLEQVRARGPVAAGEMAEPDGKTKKRGAWWGWTISKRVLEGHFAHGRLAIADRRADYARLYDLTERVIPARVRSRRVDDAEAKRELLRLAARACGVGTVDDLADYYRMPIREARAHVPELVEAGELEPVRIEGWRQEAYLDPKAARPRRVTGSALLSPFDPLVWYRPRLERLFEFDYRIEIYTPEAKRRWGYYVLPFLLEDRLVGRVDLKADRENKRLLVPAAHREPHADAGRAADALARELRTVAEWLELEEVRVARRGNLAPALAAALSPKRRRR